MGCFKLDILAENSPQFLRVVGEKDVDEIALDSNHLGNVLAVVSDLKIIDNGAYTTTTLAATDYYPFGMQMPGRRFSSPTYRYGFNGMEKDYEVKGSGNSYTTYYRQYDPRIARWKSIDPLTADFAHQSPYLSMDGNPILLNDPEGDCTDCPKDGEEGDVHTSTDVKPFTAPNGQMVSGTDGKGVSIFSSDMLSAVVYAHTGDGGWQALAFETKDGDKYVWDTDKNWYADESGEEFDDHVSFDITNMVGGAVSPAVQMFIDKVKEDDALKSFKEAYHASGSGSVGGFVWDGFKKMGSDLSAGGHTSTQAWGSLYTGFLSSGGYLAFNGSFALKNLTFAQFKALRGGTRTLGFIETFNASGKPVLQRISTEFHHVFITQRMQRLYNIPNWAVNNRLNVWQLNTIQHSIMDPYRFNFLKYGLKSQVGMFKTYNFFSTKF